MSEKYFRVAALDIPARAAGEPVVLGVRDDDKTVVALSELDARHLHSKGRLLGWTPLGHRGGER